jgi:hypothetical protein
MTSQYGACVLRAGSARLHACRYRRIRAPTRTHAHTHMYVILIAFLLQQRSTKAPQCYIIRTLPVLLVFRYTECGNRLRNSTTVNINVRHAT